jgi:hypothetical protein
MTDGGGAEHTHGAIERALAMALAEVDPVPDAVVAAAKGAFTWRTIDAELAGLTFDSAEEGQTAGVRGGGPRSLAFEFSDVVIELEVEDTNGRRAINGQVVPPEVQSLELQQIAEPTPTAVVPDQLGRFHLDDVAAGPARLFCRFGGAARHMVLTEWVVL